MTQCTALTTPGTIWSVCPSLPADYLFVVLFAVILSAHIVQTVWTREWYCWVVIFAAALQVATYITRALSILNPASLNLYTTWFILILIAPIFTNAYAYMVMGRMVYNFTTKGSVWGVKAWYFSLLFVSLDIFAFLVQIVGAAIASSGDNSDDNDSVGSTPQTGLYIYMGGICFQQLCIFIFLALAARLHMHLRQQPASKKRTTAFKMLYIEYAVVFLITGRIIFRLVEYSNGVMSSITQHEVYQYVFDSTLMFIALVLFNILHPGAMTPGKEAAWPSGQARKAMKKNGEKLHGRAGEYLALQNTFAGKMHSRDDSDIEAGFPSSPRSNAELSRMTLIIAVLLRRWRCLADSRLTDHERVSA